MESPHRVRLLLPGRAAGFDLRGGFPALQSGGRAESLRNGVRIFARRLAASGASKNRSGDGANFFPLRNRRISDFGESVTAVSSRCAPAGSYAAAAGVLLPAAHELLAAAVEYRDAGGPDVLPGRFGLVPGGRTARLAGLGNRVLDAIPERGPVRRVHMGGLSVYEDGLPAGEFPF